MVGCFVLKATPHKARVMRFAHILLAYFFRHLAQVLLGGRKSAGIETEQSDGAICAQALCGAAFISGQAATNF